jgi:TPR repeat protein
MSVGSKRLLDGGYFPPAKCQATGYSSPLDPLFEGPDASQLSGPIAGEIGCEQECDIGYYSCLKSPDAERAKRQFALGSQHWKEKEYERAHRFFLMAALQQNRAAQQTLGEIYLYDYACIGLRKGIKLWEKPQRKAMFSLGHLIGHYETTDNHELTFALYKILKKKGYSQVYDAKLARMYFKGLGTSKNEAKGVKYLEMSDDPTAIKMLRKYYLKKGDVQKALYSYERLVASDPSKKKKFSQVYASGTYYGYGFTVEPEKIERLFQSLQEPEAPPLDLLECSYLRCLTSPDNQVAQQQFERGKGLWKAGDYRKALSYFIRSGLQRHPDAYRQLSDIYRNEYKKIGLKRSALLWDDFNNEGWHQTALNRLICYYECHKDYDLLFALYSYRVELDNPEKTYKKLALLYLKGRGVPENFALGVECFEKSGLDPFVLKKLRRLYLKTGEIPKALHCYELLAGDNPLKLFKLAEKYETGRYYGHKFEPNREKAKELYQKAFDCLIDGEVDPFVLESLSRKWLSYVEGEERLEWEYLLELILYAFDSGQGIDRVFYKLAELIPTKAQKLFEKAGCWRK